jgi:multisubunit Na+/H+ antiporter MnhB subunit
LGAGAGLIAVVVLLALLADTARPLEVVSMVVVVGAALVIVLFLATPMRNRAGNLDVDTMSDRPMGEYHESAMSSGLVVSLHALAFALPSIVTLAVLVAR